MVVSIEKIFYSHSISKTKNESVVIRMTSDQKAELEKMAKAKGISMSELIMRLLQAEYENYQCICVESFEFDY